MVVSIMYNAAFAFCTIPTIASIRLSFLLVPAFEWDAIGAQLMTSLDELGAVGNYRTRFRRSSDRSVGAKPLIGLNLWKKTKPMRLTETEEEWK